MNLGLFRSVAAAGAITLAATGASAITVTEDLVANTQYTFAQNLAVGGEVVFEFTALEALNIPVFALSASGNNGGIDVGDITFGFTRPTTDTFDIVTVFGPSASGLDSLPGLSLSASESIEIIFNDGIAFDASITVSFTTTEIAPVPVPAAGGLLAAALFGAGWVARRRRT